MPTLNTEIDLQTELGIIKMYKTLKTMLCGVVLCLGSVHASAVVINFGPSSASTSGALITFNNLVAPTNAISDASITLNVQGDFNTSSEYADVSLDGFALGRILNNVTSDDAFDFSNDDYTGSSSGTTIDTGVATIALADFASLIADGFLSFAFDASSNVNCCSGSPIDLVSGTISYDVKSVSEPGALSLLSLGLMCIFLSRRKSKASV